MKKALVSIFVVAVLAGIVVFLSARITTFEECKNAGWLVRSIKVYDGAGLVEQECFLWFGKSFVKLGEPVGQLSQPDDLGQNLESKTDNQAGVAIVVTPVDTLPLGEEWKFNIVMDTHSVELDQDLTRIAILVDDQGREYQPLAWQGAEPGGHHREGALTFPALDATSAFVELQIKNVGGVAERIFKWNLQ